MDKRAASRALGRKLKAHNSHFGRYVIFGFVAAVINIIVFLVFRRWLRDSVFIANTLAFILSNLASFYFNNKAVFTTNIDDNRKLWKKLIAFFTYRIISLFNHDFFLCGDSGLNRKVVAFALLANNARSLVRNYFGLFNGEFRSHLTAVNGKDEGDGSRKWRSFLCHSYGLYV